MKVFASLIILLFLNSVDAKAQCSSEEVALTMTIYTDSWSEETYWEIVPSGNECGNGTIANGSNLSVGCAGISGADSEYPDNTMVTEGAFCLTTGQMYDFIFADSYGDGGLSFELYENGVLSHVYVGSGSFTQWTFEAGNSGLPSNDSPCNASELLVDNGVMELNNETAVSQFYEPHPAGNDCGLSGTWCENDPNVSRSVWAYFVAEDNVAYEISTCNNGTSYNTQLALYHAEDCSNFGTFQLITSNDDKFGQCTNANEKASTMHASCLNPGDYYYIQLDGWNDESGSAYLSVSTFTGETELLAYMVDVTCPVEDGQQASGSVEPYFIGTGANYNCEWTGPNGFFTTDHFIYDLGPGTYSLSATTSCGEEFNAQYVISPQEQWNVVVSGVGPECPQGTDGNIAVIAQGANPPYSFDWNGPSGFTSSEQNIESLSDGYYDLTITDDNGCQYAADYNLSATGNFEFNLGADTVLCLQDEFMVTAPADLNYLWQDGSTGNSYLVEANDWGLGPHAVLLTATTDGGCIFSDALIFTVELCEGVDETSDRAFVLYPNPTSDYFTIDFAANAGIFNYRIYNSIGGLVQEEKALLKNGQRIQTSFAPGIYFMEIFSNERRFEIPFVQK